MKEALLIMSKKELKRIDVLKEIKEKRMSQKTGSERLRLTPRHTRRLLKRYNRFGCCGYHFIKARTPKQPQLWKSIKKRGFAAH